MNSSSIRTPLAIAESLTELWSPQVIAEVDDMYVKVAKVRGEMDWHAHEHEDEMFFILRGEFTLEFDDGRMVLRPGELFVVPRGRRHHPMAKEECLLMLFERKETAHTGDARTAQTKSIAQQLRWLAAQAE
ncbi:cupin domain-containing protein [Prosthecobacter sp.]|uniref:cupin domain-containing protein n=1 Tax=Prosthecobacter sp. TaxID=1965333 RepID=UPI003782EB0B